MTETYRDQAAAIEDRVADLLGRMTIDEKVAQLASLWVGQLVVDDRFDADAAAARLVNGIGQVTRIGASTGLRPAESARLMNDIQRVAMERTRLGIPVMVHEEAVAGFCSRDATMFPQAIGLAATWDPDLLGEIGSVIREQMLAVGARQNLAPVLDVARDPRWGRVEETYGESPYLCARMGVAYVRAIQTEDPRHGVVCTGKHFLGYAASMGGRNQAPVHLGPRELRDVYAEPFAAAIREAGLASVMNSYSAIDGVPCASDPAVLTDLLRGELGFDGVVVADYYAVDQLHLNHATSAGRAEAAVDALTAGLDVELPSLHCFRKLAGEVDGGRLDEAVIDRAVTRVLTQKFQLGLFDDPYVDEQASAASFDTAPHRALARRAAQQSLCLLANDGLLPLDASALRRVAVIGPAADDQRLLQGDYHYPTHLEIIYANPLAPAAAEAGIGPDQLPEDGGAFKPGPYFTHHVTPLAGLQAALGPVVDLTHARGCSDRDADDTDIDAAVVAASMAEVAIVCVGSRSGLTTDATVGEARDAVSLDLPGAQRRLVEAVLDTGTPTVLVVISGRVHTLGDLVDRAAATIYAWLPGEEGGNALADVLLGHADPGGRLPISLPRHVGQIPIHHDALSRGDRAEFYGDYVDSSVTPLYGFGHGLSYTTFGYADLAVEPGTTTEPSVVSITVTNTGSRMGSDVVQLYARDVVASVARPVVELVGFTRVTLEPRQSTRIDFIVHPSRLAFHDRSMQRVCEPGELTFSIGPPLSPDRISQTVTLTGPVAHHPQAQVVDTVVDGAGLARG